MNFSEILQGHRGHQYKTLNEFKGIIFSWKYDPLYLRTQSKVFHTFWKVLGDRRCKKSVLVILSKISQWTQKGHLLSSFRPWHICQVPMQGFIWSLLEVCYTATNRLSLLCLKIKSGSLEVVQTYYFRGRNVFFISTKN